MTISDDKSLSPSEQSNSRYDFAVANDERNLHWLVCRECLVAWPPHDIKLGHIHYDGPDDGPWTRCDGELIELRRI